MSSGCGEDMFCMILSEMPYAHSVTLYCSILFFITTLILFLAVVSTCSYLCKIKKERRPPVEDNPEEIMLTTVTSVQVDVKEEGSTDYQLANRTYALLEAPENLPEAKQTNDAMYDEVIQNPVSIATPLPPPSPKGETKAESTVTSAPPPPPPPPLLESSSLPVYACVNKSQKKSKSPSPSNVPSKTPNMELALYSNIDVGDASLYDRLERDVQPPQGVVEPDYDIVN